MFGTAPCKRTSDRPCLQNIGVQITVEVSDGQKGQPNCYKSDQQKRNSPTRFNAIQPTQKRPSPTRRRNIRARSHPCECEINGHKDSYHTASKQIRSSCRAASEGENPSHTASQLV